MNINCLKIKNSSSIKVNKGLTLVELMVVIAIFMMITSIVIFNYGDFSSTVSLQNLTDDVALSIRKAQSYAIGARGATEGGDVLFNKSYGVHFSANQNPENPVASSNKSFLMFSVEGSPKKYVESDYSNNICGQGNNCIELFNITSNDTIESIKAYNGANLISSDVPTSSIDIVFTRPDPKAHLCYRSNMDEDCALNVSSVNITISNGKDDVKKKSKTISVQNTGQISIQ